jgi:hypothetical protein
LRENPLSPHYISVRFTSNRGPRDFVHRAVPTFTPNMSLFIAGVIGVHFVLILIAVGPWLRSVAGRHVRYKADSGHDRAGEREKRWYPLR